MQTCNSNDKFFNFMSQISAKMLKQYLLLFLFAKLLNKFVYTMRIDCVIHGSTDFERDFHFCPILFISVIEKK